MANRKRKSPTIGQIRQKKRKSGGDYKRLLQSDRLRFLGRYPELKGASEAEVEVAMLNGGWRRETRNAEEERQLRLRAAIDRFVRLQRPDLKDRPREEQIQAFLQATRRTTSGG